MAIDPDSEADELLEPGVRTVEAVNHGIYMAAVSAVNRIYSEVCDQQGVALPLLVTGGDARVVSRGIQAPHAVWPDMVYGARGLFSVDRGRASRPNVGGAGGATAGGIGKDSRWPCILHAALTECVAFRSGSPVSTRMSCQDD